MQRVLVAAVMASLLTVAACGNGSGKRAQTAHPPATTAAVTSATSPAAAKTRFTDGELRSALLTADDLPTGWSTEAHTEPSTEPSSSWGTCTELADADGWKGSSTATGDFLAPAGATITEELDAATPAKLEQLFDVLAKASGCGSFTVAGLDINLNGLSFPKIGDRTFAMRLAWTTSGHRMGADTIYVRRGNVLMTIANTPSYATGAYLPDTATTEDFARRALARIDRVLTP